MYVSSYFLATCHHITHCRACGRSSDLTEFFLENCHWCNSSDVTHEYIPANTEMLLHMCKVHLGQTDKSLLVVKTNNNHSDDSRYKNLSEEEADKKLAKLADILSKEYGPKKELGHDELLIDVKKCA